jgi:hypothetical protein
MKITSRIIVFSLLVIVTLASCNSVISIPTAQKEIAVSKTAIPTLTPILFLSVTPLQQTETSTPLPVSGIPTTVILNNELIWTECVLPYQDYFHNKSDIELITTCLDMEFPFWDDSDKAKFGERVHGPNGDNLRLIVGDVIYETRYAQSNFREYELLRNGVVIATVNANFIVADPNRRLGNLGGKIVWEVISEPPVLVVDGENINEEYQLEGSFFPYEINGKLIYLAKKNGKYHIVYDGNVIGAEFDEISMAYCCAKLSVSYGKGQYWFLGRRNGVQYVVALH